MNKEDPSTRSYTVSVCLSGIFGILGIHHFYLGRWIHGLFDLSLSIIGFYLIFSGEPLAGYAVLFVDLVHTVIVTYWLLTGQYRDGQGRRVLYPGQKISSQS
jgi:TM2 domain-containing membrane protein YozV